MAEIQEAVERFPDSLREAALEHMLSTSEIFGEKLFAHYDHPDIPGTNNDHEAVFRDTRRHERLITGQKSTARRTVRDGPFLLPALERTRRQPFSAEDLAGISEKAWRDNLQKLQAARAHYNYPAQLRENLPTVLAELVKQCRDLARARAP